MSGIDASGLTGRVPADALPPRVGISSLSPSQFGIKQIPHRAVAAARRALSPRRTRANLRQQVRSGRKVLVAGWFGWSGHGATAGDVLACQVVCEWLHAAGRPFDVASLLPSLGGVDWRQVDPAAYSDVIFVCGPVGPQTPLSNLLERFSSSRHLGVDLTMLEPLAVWNPFEALIERDSDEVSRPDLSFAAAHRQVPILGVVLVEPYIPEYAGRDMQAEARAAVAGLINSREAAVVEIDTRLEANARGLRTADEVASLIARMDAVVTTRLHGLALSIKNGVPALAIDPVSGGAKIRQQAEAIGWPHVVTADQLGSTDLDAKLAECLTPQARDLARACSSRAVDGVEAIHAQFLALLEAPARATSVGV